MPVAQKRPCTICRRWFRPDPRIGTRQRACRNPKCQTARRKKTQAAWRAKNPDYYIARRIQASGSQERGVEPLRLPEPLSRLPWDIAQDEFGAQGADFLGVMGTVILGAAQDKTRAYLIDSTRDRGPLPQSP